MTRDQTIIAKVKRRASDARTRIDGEILDDPPKPLADEAFLATLERELGFPLPALLKRLYLEVGDGGFGPGYGLFGARSGHYLSDEPFTLAELYFANFKGTWRARMLPICEWGCSLFGCVDCSGDDAWVFTSDSDENPIRFSPENLTFRDWIEGWADGLDRTPGRDNAGSEDSRRSS